MNNYMRDYLMRRRMPDGRNPYGSEGGYVVSRRARGDRRMGRDYANDYPNRYSDSENQRLNSQREEDYVRGRGYDGHYEPIEIMGRFNGYYGGAEDYSRGMREQDYNYGRDYGYMPYYPPYMMDYGYDRDYAQGGEYMPDKDIKMWADKLMRDVEEKDKQFLSKENIRKRADEMGIKFDKYSFEEFYVTVLMKYTDHCKTLGTANMDIYLKLAKDFFEDPDTALRYGEKLAAYYYDIVEGM